jgi:choline kinase
MLAAGVGQRLGNGADGPPKALLEFGGKSLLARHLEILRHFGIERVTIATGYKSSRIESEIARLGAGFARCVLNPDYEAGSIVSLWSVRAALADGADILLMDADVLYDHRLIARLLESRQANCFLMDRDIEPGEEPVKLCVREGRLVDFHKRVAATYDFCGESVGFFRLSPSMAAKLAARAEEYVAGGRRGEWYEEAIRDLLLASAPGTFGYEDVTGLPWIEIDFPEDVARARDEILPRLADLPRGSAA